MREKGVLDIQIRAVGNQLSSDRAQDIKEALEAKPKKRKVRMYACVSPDCNHIDKSCRWSGVRMTCNKCGGEDIEVFAEEVSNNEYRKREKSFVKALG